MHYVPQRLRPVAKAGIVVAGYVLAVAIATLVVRLYIAATSHVERQTYSGMTAFGDSLVFLAALGVAAVPATGAAFYFLRPYGRLWLALSVASLATAATAVVAVVLSIAPRVANIGSTLQAWSMAAPLRIFAAPLLGLFFLVAGLFAPTRPGRVCLLAAASIEFVAFASVFLTWVVSSR